MAEPAEEAEEEFGRVDQIFFHLSILNIVTGYRLQVSVTYNLKLVTASHSERKLLTGFANAAFIAW